MKNPTRSQMQLDVGDVVNVKLDNGKTVVDTVKNRPTKMGGHTWMAWLEDHGSYLLTRVTLKKRGKRDASNATETV